MIRILRDGEGLVEARLETLQPRRQQRPGDIGQIFQKGC
jgi:hypothetical protein